MKTHPHRAVEPFTSRSSPHAPRRRCAALAAALAVLVLSTAPAGAAPSFNQGNASRNAPPGSLVSVWIGGVFNNAGTNPKFTGAVFSTTEYYVEGEAAIGSGGTRLWYRAKSSDALSAMSPQPPNPFTVTCEVTMTNDEGETASGTISFNTGYERVEPPGPSLSKTTANAPAGLTVSAFADYFFDDAGTNPRFTSATFSTMEYYVAAGVSGGILDIQVKTSDELNALDSPPDNPFTVAVTLTMTNNEGQTATGTVDYSTSY